MKYNKMLIAGFSAVIASSLYTTSIYAADGKAVYNKVCKTCHLPGILGAPKINDKTDWEPRIKKGVAVLQQNAIKGFKGKKGTMPPKGGSAYLSDDEVKAAVIYMIDMVSSK